MLWKSIAFRGWKGHKTLTYPLILLISRAYRQNNEEPWKKNGLLLCFTRLSMELISDYIPWINMSRPPSVLLSLSESSDDECALIPMWVGHLCLSCCDIRYRALRVHLEIVYSATRLAWFEWMTVSKLAGKKWTISKMREWYLELWKKIGWPYPAVWA